MGVGPIEAVRRRSQSGGMTTDDVDVMELNEAFAAQVLPVCARLGFDPFSDRVNPHGGAIALGHPFGMTGARIMTTLLERPRDARPRDRTRDDVRRRRAGDGHDRPARVARCNGPSAVATTIWPAAICSNHGHELGSPVTTPLTLAHLSQGPPKASELVAEDLRAHILGNALPEGVPLPSEAELIARLGVSRATVREGLRLLPRWTYRGEARASRGDRGASPERGAYEPVACHDRRLEGVSLDELFEFRPGDRAGGRRGGGQTAEDRGASRAV